MVDKDQSPEPGATTLKPQRLLRTKGLLAEYTTGQTPAGEWFALGSVRSEIAALQQPAWVLVGTGRTVDDAVSGLLTELESQARRVLGR